MCGRRGHPEPNTQCKCQVPSAKREGEPGMKRFLLRLWKETDGFVLSSEMVMYGTVGVVGVTTGYAALRDSINTELDDVAKALGATDQSYFVNGVYGHSAWTAGSAFFDRVDRNDIPQCV